MDDYSCIMCADGDLETRNHLFFLCPFAHICWQYLCPTWVPPQHHDIQSFIQSLKTPIKEPFFMEIIILTAWSIWTTRNDYISKGTPPSLYRCGKKLKDELYLLLHKATRKSYGGFRNWVERFR
jgi:hypothetical protein